MITRLCFACGKKLGRNPALIRTVDGQTAFVGSECLKEVVRGGADGWQPPEGRAAPIPAHRGGSEPDGDSGPPGPGNQRAGVQMKRNPWYPFTFRVVWFMVLYVGRMDRPRDLETYR
jgi:hypothetical protein